MVSVIQQPSLSSEVWKKPLPADAGRKPQRPFYASTSGFYKPPRLGSRGRHPLRMRPTLPAHAPSSRLSMRTRYSLTQLFGVSAGGVGVRKSCVSGFCLASQILFKSFGDYSCSSTLSKVRQVRVLSTQIFQAGGEAVKNIFCSFPPTPTACSFEARYIVTKRPALIPYLPTAHGTVLIVFLKYLFPEAARKKWSGPSAAAEPVYIVV